MSALATVKNQPSSKHFVRNVDPRLAVSATSSASHTLPYRSSMSRSYLFLSLSLVVIATPVRGQDSVAAGPRSVSSGVFTVDQADRGRASHRTNCTSCHSSSKYVGQDFAALYLGGTVFDMLDKIRTTMPDDNPGALPIQDYVDIIAYILNINGYPRGAVELPADEAALKSLKIDVPPPPRSGLAAFPSFPHARPVARLQAAPPVHGAR
jgi:mono/diheme cytochrome c family protein